MPFVLPGVMRIPDRNSFLEGAMLEPVNTVLKAVNRLSLLRGDTVLVAGQGPIGLMFTRLLALRGMRVVATDLLDTRLKLAKEFGAADVRNPKLHAQRSTLHASRPFDAAVIAVPSDAVVREALASVRGGGQVLIFAHTKRGAETPVDLATVCVDEKDVIGSYSADFRLQTEVARLVFSRKLDVRRLITHQFPLDQTAAAVNLAAHPTPDSLKVAVGSFGL
jgi:L-iditol 2-dehydrogenase